MCPRFDGARASWDSYIICKLTVKSTMTDEILSPAYAPIPFAAAAALIAFTVVMVVRTRAARERVTPTTTVTVAFEPP